MQALTLLVGINHVLFIQVRGEGVLSPGVRDLHYTQEARVNQMAGVSRGRGSFRRRVDDNYRHSAGDSAGTSASGCRLLPGFGGGAAIGQGASQDPNSCRRRPSGVCGHHPVTRHFQHVSGRVGGSSSCWTLVKPGRPVGRHGVIGWKGWCVLLPFLLRLLSLCCGIWRWG